VQRFEHAEERYMISIEDLKRIYLLQNLTDEMLEKMLPLTEVRQYKERELVFEEGEKANSFYMLKRGKILLEVELSETIIVSLGSIKTGYSFGWSSLVPDSTHTSYAVCTEPSEVLIIPGGSFRGLLDEDHTMGYLIMDGVTQVLKGRLNRRTGQFLKVISRHPEIGALLGY
jgi:CRP/FNR family cyclic AMP-dependent transcriptional regulator